jgi:hypothetical protein
MNNYNITLNRKKNMYEYASQFPIESYIFSYINAHHYLHSDTLTRDLKTIEKLNNKCMTCNVNLVIFRHKECQKCYTLNTYVKHESFAFYLVYSKTPCFCFDCLDYYGMSSRLQSDYMTNKDLNELQNLFDQKSKEDKFSKQIDDLKIEMEKLKEEVKLYKNQVNDYNKKN